MLAAQRIGDDGRLISTDFAQGMVDAAGRFGEKQGLGNVEYRVLDAEKMDLEDSSVDGVLCRFGYMLMADSAAALGETRRVLRDGGRLSFAVWAEPLRNLWAAIPGMCDGRVRPPAAARSRGARHLRDGRSGPDPLPRHRRPDSAEPQIEEVSVVWGYDDPDVHWEKS